MTCCWAARSSTTAPRTPSSCWRWRTRSATPAPARSRASSRSGPGMSCPQSRRARPLPSPRSPPLPRPLRAPMRPPVPAISPPQTRLLPQTMPRPRATTSLLTPVTTAQASSPAPRSTPSAARRGSQASRAWRSRDPMGTSHSPSCARSGRRTRRPCATRWRSPRGTRRRSTRSSAGRAPAGTTTRTSRPSPRPSPSSPTPCRTGAAPGGPRWRRRSTSIPDPSGRSVVRPPSWDRPPDACTRSSPASSAPCAVRATPRRAS